MVGGGAGLLGEKAEYHHQLYDTCLEQVVGGLKISKSVPLFIAKDWIRARAVSTSAWKFKCTHIYKALLYEIIIKPYNFSPFFPQKKKIYHHTKQWAVVLFLLSLLRGVSTHIDRFNINPNACIR